MTDTEHATPQSAEAPQSARNEQAAGSSRPAGGPSPHPELPAGAMIILPTRNAVLFPGIVVPLTLGRQQSIAGAQAAAQADKPVGVLLQSDPSVETPGPEHLHRVGAVGEILRYVTAPDGNHHLVTRGIRRFRVLEFLPGYPFLVARVDEVGEAEVFSTEIAARVHQLKERAREAMSLLPNLPTEIASAIEQIQSPSALADFVANVSDLTPAEKQDLLETFDVGERLDKLLRYLAQQIEVLRLSKQIGEQTQESLSGRQREHILREQLRQIQKELGEGEDGQAEIAELREAIAKAGMPEEAENQALKELKRLERMPEASAEHGMVRSYLDWLIELPWSKLVRRADRHRRSPPHPRRGPLRPAQDQAAHPRISRGAQAEARWQEPDPVLRRPARRGQDLARPIDRPGHGPQIRAAVAWRRA